LDRWGAVIAFRCGASPVPPHPRTLQFFAVLDESVGNFALIGIHDLSVSTNERTRLISAREAVDVLPPSSHLVLAVAVLPGCCRKGQEKSHAAAGRAAGSYSLGDHRSSRGNGPYGPERQPHRPRRRRNALARWGRLTPVTDPSQADLIIVIRKGNGKLVQPTIGNATGNNPPPVIGQRTDTGITASGRAGPPLEPTSEPHPQIEASAPDDTFAVYRGNPAYIITAANSDNPLDAPPVWRYIAKDALESPSVPAVEFRKVIAESEKALAGP
jgi:hypothetical protein